MNLNFMMMVFFSFLFFSFLFFSFFLFFSRFLIFFNQSLKLLLNSIDTTTVKFLFFLLFIMLVCLNFMGNVPLNSIPTLFYSQTVTLSLLFWVPLMICVFLKDLKKFLGHMLPYGSPLALMIFLPIIEIFSQIIRPFTLMIRLSTNLSSGHIMMYMFSYFMLLSSFLAPFISLVLVLLLVLEFFISLLQAYIFVSLLVLYSKETV